MAVGAEVLGPGDKDKQITLFDLSEVPYNVASVRKANGKLKRGRSQSPTLEEVSAREEARKMPELVGRSRPDEMRKRADTDG